MLFRNNNGKLSENKGISENNLMYYNGAIISSIGFIRTEMFKPLKPEMPDHHLTVFESTVNKLHYSTRKQILNNYLLFHTGDTINDVLIAENERLLREQPFIMDARFIIDNSENADSAGLILQTQDILPIGFDVRINKASTGQFSLWHYNVLGFGHQFNFITFWDTAQEPQAGYSFLYRMPNIAGSFAAANVEYIHKWDQESYIVNINRDFKSISFNNAGGIYYEHTSSWRDFELLDTVLTNVNLHYSNTDLWAGYFFRLNNNRFPVTQAGIFLSSRFSLFTSVTVPSTAMDYLYQYQRRTSFLISAGYTKQGFRKDNLIYNFGRTEDVPFGYLFEITTGIEYGVPEKRYYLAASGSLGKYFSNTSYLFGLIRAGTYLNKGMAEQGFAELKLNYYSRIHHIGQYELRNYITFHYLNGLNRLPGEYTTIADKEGIRGLKGDALKGLEKMVLQVESDIYSAFRLLGFRFAFFGYTDLGLVSRHNSIFNDPGLVSGLGIGVRIRNDQLVFNTFVLRFSVFPGKPDHTDARYLIASGLQKLKMNDFFPHRPEIYIF